MILHTFKIWTEEKEKEREREKVDRDEGNFLLKKNDFFSVTLQIHTTQQKILMSHVTNVI